MPVRIKIKNPGSLSKYGYSLRESQSHRRTALGRAVRKYGYAPVMRKVNALYVFNKNQNKSLALILSRDKEWLHKTYSTRMGFNKGGRKSSRKSRGKKSRKGRKSSRKSRKGRKSSRKSRKGRKSSRKSRGKKRRSGARRRPY